MLIHGYSPQGEENSGLPSCDLKLFAATRCWYKMDRRPWQMKDMALKQHNAMACSSVLKGKDDNDEEHEEEGEAECFSTPNRCFPIPMKQC